MQLYNYYIAGLIIRYWACSKRTRGIALIGLGDREKGLNELHGVRGLLKAEIEQSDGTNLEQVLERLETDMANYSS